MKKKILTFLDNIENYICMLILVVMFVIILEQVILRFVFRDPNSWSEEMARYLHIALIYFGAGFATRMDQHIRIDAVLNIYLEKIRPYVKLVGDVLFVIFAIVIAVIGFQLAASVHSLGQTSTALKIPMSLVYLLCPIGYSLIAIRQIQLFIIAIKNRKKPLIEEGGAN